MVLARARRYPAIFVTSVRHIAPLRVGSVALALLRGSHALARPSDCLGDALGGQSAARGEAAATGVAPHLAACSPEFRKKGVPCTDFCQLLCTAYCVKGNQRSNFVWVARPQLRSASSNTRLVRSFCPSICGW